MYLEVKDLSPALRAALKAVGYGCADVRVLGAEQVDTYSEGNAGSRGFVVLVNLDTGARKGILGSWGGANMFTRTLVDEGSQSHPLPENGAIVKGTIGYPRTFATIYMHPSSLRLLESGGDELSDAEQQAIYCFAAIKGGEYRRGEMRRRGVSTDTVDSLVERGYLKRNRAGATQITTKGKNARTIRN